MKQEHTMKAAVYHGRRDIRLEDVAIPGPADDELLLCIACAGICGTDAGEFAHGPSLFPIDHRHSITGHCGPMIPGHEFSGHVVRVGADVTGFVEGDLVTSGAGISCGTCRQCRSGRTNLCERYATVGLQRHGGLAEFTTVPATACLNVERRTVTSDVAAMAQPMSIAVHALRRGRLEHDDQVVVLGAGGIGAFLIHAAAKAGAHVTAVDLDSARLDVARRLGAAATVEATLDEPLLEQLRGLTEPPRAVFECTGTPTGVGAAVGSVERGGRVVVVGLHKAPVPIDLTRVALEEKELIGTLAHVFDADFGRAVDLLEDETDMWAEVAPTVIPLDDLVDVGIRPIIDGGSAPIKALLDPRIETARLIRTDRAAS